MRRILFLPVGVLLPRFLCSALLFAFLTPNVPADKVPRQDPSTPNLSLEEQERFLLKAKVIKTRGASKGITGSLRATLTDGRITHDASIQSVDIYKPLMDTPIGPQINFRDTYKFNIAAYRLAKLLGIESVPPSVERRYGGKRAAFTWWIDDVLMDEARRLDKKIHSPDPDSWNRQMFVVHVFDQLIDNIDRNLGNLQISKDWKIWMIDHTRAFRPIPTIRVVRNLTKCDRALLERLRQLSDRDLKRELGDLLTNSEMKALVSRRALIVECFEKLGEAGLYDLNPKVSTVIPFAESSGSRPDNSALCRAAHAALSCAGSGFSMP